MTEEEIKNEAKALGMTLEEYEKAYENYYEEAYENYYDVSEAEEFDYWAELDEEEARDEKIRRRAYIESEEEREREEFAEFLERRKSEYYESSYEYVRTHY